MLLDSLILGTIIAKLRGGKFFNFLHLQITAPWLILLAFMIQYPIMFLYPKILFESIIVSYAILFIFLYVNKTIPGITLMISGMFLNMLVMVVNNGRIPVETEAARDLSPSNFSTLLAGDYGKHIAMTAHTHLNFLGDIFYLQFPYPHPIIVSLGDIIFSIGIFVLVQRVMIKSKFINKGVLLDGYKS